MIQQRRYLPLCSGLWQQNFSIFQSVDGLLLKDFVYINYQRVCGTKKLREGVIWCYSERSLEELEGKHSDLRRELVTMKEALNQITLQKEVLEDDKTSLVQALSKVNCFGLHQVAQFVLLDFPGEDRTF